MFLEIQRKTGELRKHGKGYHVLLCTKVLPIGLHHWCNSIIQLSQ